MSDAVAGDIALGKRAGRRPIPLKRIAIVLGFLILVTAAGGYGWNWWTLGRFIASTDDAYVGGNISDLAPKISGLIVAVPVSDNQAVHAGEVLVRIDDRDYRAAQAEAEANVAAAQAALGNLASRRTLQRAAIAEADAALGATGAELVRTRDDVGRYRALSASQAASVQTYQNALAAYRTAQANDTKAHAADDATRLQLGVLASEADQDRAALARAIAARDLARLDVGYTVITAPIDGTIGNRSAHVGQFAASGAPLLSLVPAQGLWVDANFKESQLAGMHVGQVAKVVADADPRVVFSGHVASLAPATGAVFSVIPAENATGNFTKIVQRVPVRILLDGDAGALGALRPGLSVSVSVDER
jgi:membrane fusion protein, multidrug efflux system